MKFTQIGSFSGDFSDTIVNRIKFMKNMQAEQITRETVLLGITTKIQRYLNINPEILNSKGM